MSSSPDQTEERPDSSQIWQVKKNLSLSITHYHPYTVEPPAPMVRNTPNHLRLFSNTFY